MELKIRLFMLQNSVKVEILYKNCENSVHLSIFFGRILSDLPDTWHYIKILRTMFNFAYDFACAFWALFCAVHMLFYLIIIVALWQDENPWSTLSKGGNSVREVIFLRPHC